MSTTNQVPSNIAEIIEQKRQALLAERQAKKEAEKREREEVEATGRQKYDEYIQAAMLEVPDYLRQYVLPAEEIPDFYRIGKGWEKPRDWLYFQVPGLSEIIFAPNAKGASWKYQIAHEGEYRYYDSEEIEVEPSLHFSDRQYGWTDDIDYALGCAHAEMQKYQKFVIEWEATKAEHAKEQEQRRQSREISKAREAEADARREQAQIEKQAKEQAEEQALFDALKDDPVAMHMLKAFVLLRDERNSFREQLENADYSFSNMQAHYDQRTAELRRQTDELERRAEDERSRLQSDLDDAEAKLKKAARGW